MLGRVAETVVRLAGLAVNEHVVSSLLPDSERLKELRHEFCRMTDAKMWKLFSFQEQYGVSILNNQKVALFK